MSVVEMKNQTRGNRSRAAHEWLSAKYDEALEQWQNDETAQDQFNHAVFDLAVAVLKTMGIDFKNADDEQVGAAAAGELTDAFNELVPQLLWQYLESLDVLPFGRRDGKTVGVLEYLKEKAERTQQCS